MKKIALVGGLGPEGTLDYYRAIIDGFKDDYDQLGYPEIVIESLNMKPMVELAEAGDWGEISEIIAGKFEDARHAGAEVGAIAANTPHKAFASIQAATLLPLVSIVAATRRAVEERGIQKALLLGTAFTMESDFYFEDFAKADIELVVPGQKDREYMHEKLFSEIEHGIAKPDTRQDFIGIIERALTDSGAEGIVSACTEFPLVFTAEDFAIEFFDTAAIHIASIVAAAKT